MLKEKLICPDSFCSLHNFFAGYIQRNMLVPGQVEKWIVVMNINHFPITKLPVQIFKDAARELSANFMEGTAKQVIVNLTFMQNAAAKFLQKFLDPVTVSRQLFCNCPDPAQFDEFIFKSQRPITYGGTAPVVTLFWPPIMPPLAEDEVLRETTFKLVERKDYMKFLSQNPELRAMPRRLR